MTCQNCGREDGHWLGCETAKPKAKPVERVAPVDECEHDACSEPKKEWSGKGAKPKYCAAGHKKEK